MKIDDNILKKLNNNLFLVFTGIDRRANTIAKSYIKTLNNKNFNNLNFIMNSVDKAVSYLKEGNIDDFGSLLHESWVYKRQLSKQVSNEVIDNYYKKAIQNGALGGKILGAGGGGFMIFYVQVSNHSKFKRAFKNKVLIPFEFEDKGSEIIFKN